jgi:hypothetical protein
LKLRKSKIIESFEGFIKILKLSLSHANIREEKIFIKKLLLVQNHVTFPYLIQLVLTCIFDIFVLYYIIFLMKTFKAKCLIDQYNLLKTTSIE